MPSSSTTTSAIRSEKRAYYWKDSGPLTRVTDALNTFASPELEAYKARVLATYAVKGEPEWKAEFQDDEDRIRRITQENKRQLKIAADRGTNIHTYAEALGKGETLPTYVEEMEPRVKHLQQFFADVQPNFIMQEEAVFHLTLGYGGRFDGIAEIPGLGLWMVDYKSAKAAYPKNALQMSAYYNAEFIGHGDGTTTEMPELQGGLVVCIRENDYLITPVEIGREPFELFKIGLRAHHLLADADSFVLPTLDLTQQSLPQGSTEELTTSLRTTVGAFDEQSKAEMRKFMKSFHIPNKPGDMTPLQLKVTAQRAQTLGAETLNRERVQLVIDTPLSLVKQMTEQLWEAGIVSAEEQQALMQVVLGFMPKRRLTKKQTHELFAVCQKVAGGEWELSFGEGGDLIGFTNSLDGERISIAK